MFHVGRVSQVASKVTYYLSITLCHIERQWMFSNHWLLSTMLSEVITEVMVLSVLFSLNLGLWKNGNIWNRWSQWYGVNLF